jgi:2,5-diketo-D-gluconate reductase B
MALGGGRSSMSGNVRNLSEVVPIPSLGLGTWKLNGTLCVERVREALELGYAHVDTAEMYENEREVGRGIRESGRPRETVFLTTKIWPVHLGRDDVRNATEESLRRLGTEYVDLLLIHWPNFEIPLRETLSAMVELRRQGKTRHIGVSNFTVDLWRRALELGPVAVNEIEFHPFLDQTPIQDFAGQEGLALIGYSPLARGRVVRDETLQEIGRRYGKSAAQVALRWILDEGAAAIPKASSRSHLEENRSAADFELDDRDRADISSLRGRAREVDPSWAPWH